MEYRLSTTFAELGYSQDLPDRLLTVLLETMPKAGPAIGQNMETGELTVTMAFEAARPTEDVDRLTNALDAALARAGVQEESTVLDVHIVAVYDDEGFGALAADALQPA